MYIGYKTDVPITGNVSTIFKTSDGKCFGIFNTYKLQTDI